MHTTLTLKKDDKIINVEKMGLLGEVPESVEVYMDMPSRSSPFTSEPSLSSRDLMSFIEEPELEVGQYTLEIGVPIGYFLKSSKFSTCLDFDLVIEYISRRKMDANYNPDDEVPVQVLSVNPPGAKQLSITD